MADVVVYDRVEESEETILDAVKGVSDTVSDLPTSLETDFTEVKEAIADVKSDVALVKSDTSSTLQKIGDVNSILDTINGEVV